MYPWSLANQNTKYLTDQNLRQSFALDNITNTLQVWNALDDITGLVHGPGLHYKKRAEIFITTKTKIIISIQTELKLT